VQHSGPLVQKSLLSVIKLTGVLFDKLTSLFIISFKFLFIKFIIKLNIFFDKNNK